MVSQNPRLAKLSKIARANETVDGDGDDDYDEKPEYTASCPGYGLGWAEKPCVAPCLNQVQKSIPRYERI